MDVRALRFRVGAAEPERLPASELGPAPDDDAQLLWIDVRGSVDQAGLTDLEARLGLDGALQRAVSEGPGIRFGDGVIHLAVTALGDARDDEPAQRVTLRMLAAPNLVVSFHEEPLPGLDEPIRIVASDPRFGRLQAGTFLGLLLDGLLDGYFREVERIERVIDRVDERALTSDDAQPILDQLVALRRRIAELRRALAPQREVFAALVRPVDPEASSPIGWPWPGLPTRLERALDAIEHARDQLLGSFDLVSTRTAERTNDVMRLLTVVSGLLLPSIVIAGVMGMNFDQPFFDEPNNFLLVVGGMVGLSLLTLGIARWRDWV